MRFEKKNLTTYLELEGQGRGIIMEVTRPLLLGPLYLVKWPVNPNILAASVCHIHQFFNLLFDSYDIERLLLNFGIIMLRAFKYHVGVT